MKLSRRFRRTIEGCSFKPSLGLCLFEEGFALDLFGFLITLPFLDRFAYEPHEIMESWGIRYFERGIWLDTGRGYKVWHMPWTLEHIKHEVLRSDGKWVPYVSSWSSQAPDGRREETFPYRYVLRSGEVQERTATVYVDRREWRQRWLKWCPLFALKKQSIDVSFSGEVGERSGSWKGGTIGCDYTMRPGESAEDTLRRMEQDRKFT